MSNSSATHRPKGRKLKPSEIVLLSLLGLLLIGLAANRWLGRDQALIDALRHRDYAGARALLAAGANPNVREAPSNSLLERFMALLHRQTPQTKAGTPVLFIALGDGQPGMVYADLATIRMLLDRGADPNARDNKGNFPLQIAATSECQLGDPRVLTDAGILLLQHGADAKRRPDLVVNILEQAVTEQSMPRVQTLLAYCPPLNMEPSTQNVLFNAVCFTEKPNLQIVKLLLDAGARPQQGMLHMALNRDAALVQLLLDHGAKLLPDDLIQAAYDGRKDLVQLLLAHGASPKARNSNGESAVDAAIASGFSDARKAEIIDILLRAGADPNANNRDGTTPLKYATDRRLAQSIAVLEQHGATSSAR